MPKAAQPPVINARTQIAGGALGAVAGVAVCVSGPALLGGALLLAGLAGGLWGLHRLGRSGPDQPESGPPMVHAED